MRRLVVSTVLAALCALSLASSATAQVSRIPNSGCPNAPYPQPVGQPAIGQGFGVIAPPCRTPNAPQFIVLGLPGNIALNPPLACMRGCVLACRPLDVIPGSAWRTVIPRDPRLVGACFCVQAACVERTFAGPCVHLSGALSVCITR